MDIYVYIFYSILFYSTRNCFSKEAPMINNTAIKFNTAVIKIPLKICLFAQPRVH